MPVHFTKEFLDDLVTAQDVRLLRKVVNHTMAEDGSFKTDKDDHRYKGIKDAWIRYISQGGAAYRVIYIRKSENVFLYRVGPHKVEDHLIEPDDIGSAVRIEKCRVEFDVTGQRTVNAGFLLKTTEAVYLSRFLTSMYHLRHKQIFIVSPYLDLALLESRHHFGRFLDKALEEETYVAVITVPPDDNDLPAFTKMEERGFEVFFVTRLHAKVYLFDIDPYAKNPYQKDAESRAIVGSSNFTFPGIGFDDAEPNEELCCALPIQLMDEVRTYLTKLAFHADDCKSHIIKRKRSWKT